VTHLFAQFRPSQDRALSARGTLAAVVVLGVLLALPSQLRAAPHPATSSSQLVAPKLGMFRSPDGFRMHAGESGWLQTPPPAGNSTILTVYRSPKPESRASLTVRVDRLTREVTAERYVQRWLKDYPRFGFDVLGTQAFTQSGLKAQVIDLINRDSKMQLRQIVFVNESQKRAAILTCRDLTDQFADSLKRCNSIIKSFEW